MEASLRELCHSCNGTGQLYIINTGVTIKCIICGGRKVSLEKRSLKDRVYNQFASTWNMEDVSVQEARFKQRCDDRRRFCLERIAVLEQLATHCSNEENFKRYVTERDSMIMLFREP